MQQYQQQVLLVMEKYVLFAGNPDQGIRYVGELFIEALAEAGWHAVCVTSSVQAGVAQCLVAISDQSISERYRSSPDVGVMLSQAAADRYESAIKPAGLLVMNASAIRRPALRRDTDVVFVPTEQEEEDADPILSTLIVFGALMALTGWASQEEVMEVVRKACTKDEACRALQRGIAFIDDMATVNALTAL